MFFFPEFRTFAVVLLLNRIFLYFVCLMILFCVFVFFFLYFICVFVLAL